MKEHRFWCDVVILDSGTHLRSAARSLPGSGCSRSGRRSSRVALDLLLTASEMSQASENKHTTAIIKGRQSSLRTTS